MSPFAAKNIDSASNRSMLSLLKNNRIFDAFYSHVSLINPKGKYSFASRDVFEDFWLFYQRVVAEGNTVGIAEVPQSFIPVIVDIDLQFDLDCKLQDSGHYYKMDFVKVIISSYRKILREMIDIQDENLLACAWLSKEPYIKESASARFWKNGFHLQFYNLFVNKIDLEIRVIPRVLQELSKALTDSHLEFILNPVNFFDTKAVGNTWMLYGSSKSEDQAPYKVNRVFNSQMEEIDLQEAFSNVVIFNSNDERIHFSKDNYELYLPRIFSIIPSGRQVHDIEKATCIRDYIDFSKAAPVKKSQPRTAEEAKEDIKMARDLVDIISPERSVGHNDWMSVGWALYNITNGSEQGLDIWIKFSIQKEDHDEPRCIYEWSRMENKGSITIGTLKFYARQDNEHAYLNYISRVETTKKVNLSEKGLADLLVSHIQGEFVYCKKKWFHFVGHYWKICDEGIELIRKMESILLPLLKKMKQNAANLDDDDEDGEESGLAKKISKTLSKLNSASFIENIMKWCKVRFHDEEFEDGLNKNRYIIGFTNGVFDFKQNLFRKGEPSDMITNHMPIEYKVYNESDDEVIEVKNFFEKIFPNQNIRRYFYDIMSEIFIGYNHRKHVYFFTGAGDNGKSMTQMFFEKMLGRLSIKVPTTVITSKKPATGGTTEELARSGGGTRALWLEEPNQDEVISEGIFKHLSGNDSFYARALYQSGMEIVPMFTLFIVCNGCPKFKNGGDKAVWNRVRVVKFESTFNNNAPKDPEQQMINKTFPRDPNLDQRIPELTSALAWFLLEHYKLPKLEDPPEVLEATEEYRGANDLYAQFVSDCFLPEEGASVHDLLAIEHFKSFMAVDMNCAKAKIPPIAEFDKIISRYIGDIDKNMWHGYRLVAPRGAAHAAAQNEAARGSYRPAEVGDILEGGAREM